MNFKKMILEKLLGISKIKTPEQAEKANKEAKDAYNSTAETAALDKMKDIDSPLLSSRGYSFDKNEIMKKQADFTKEFEKSCKKQSRERKR